MKLLGEDIKAIFKLRTLIIGILFIIAEVTNLKSQDLNIHKTDGSIITIPLSTIDSITFFESGVTFDCGTSIITDADGNNYNTVQIGDQCWMKENLKVGTMIDGNIAQSNNGTIEKYCYDNLESNCINYGGIYQWDETMGYDTTQGVQGICPEGWHLPTFDEWNVLISYLEGESIAGGKAKATGTIQQGTGLWQEPNTGATNSSGFTGFPGGGLLPDGTGTFVSLDAFGYFWSSTKRDYQGYPGAYYSWLLFNDETFPIWSWAKELGISVRCLRNESNLKTHFSPKNSLNELGEGLWHFPYFNLSTPNSKK